MLRTNIFLLLAKSFHRAMRQRQLKCRELDVVAGLPKITVHVHERMWDTGISLEDNFVSVGQEFAGISLALVSHGITAVMTTVFGKLAKLGAWKTSLNQPTSAIFCSLFALSWGKVSHLSLSST